MWRSSYLFLKKPVALAIFGGGGGSKSRDPIPPSLWIQKSRESIATIDTPKYTVVQKLQVGITNSVYKLIPVIVVVLCSGPNLSVKINKG